MSVSVAMIALKGESFPTFERLSVSLKERWPELEVVEGWGEESDEGSEDEASDLASLFYTVDGEKVVVAAMPMPIPWTDLEGPCATSILWEDAEEQLKEHDQHLIVSVMSDQEEIASAILMTQAIAAVLDATGNVVGVYYGNATLVIPPGLYQDMANLLPEEYPIFIWIDFRVGPNEEGLTSGFTAGMASLGHMEIECENASEEYGEFRERLYGLCHYLLENGPVIEDGHTVGADATEKIMVKYADSAFGHEGQVMRLDYQPNQKKRPWWRPF